MGRKLEEADFEAAAGDLECDVPAIKAVAEVEAPGGGFLASGRPKILFEARWFHRFTDGKYDATHPNISSPTWNKHLYRGGEAEYSRLAAAQELSKTAALKSASWGRFQIMGYNYAACGYSSVEEFVKDMEEEEGAHLQAFVNFLQSQRLDDEIRGHKWAAFAMGYNGERYRENHYDTKLAAAHKKFAARAVPPPPPSPHEPPAVERPDTLGEGGAEGEEGRDPQNARAPTTEAADASDAVAAAPGSTAIVNAAPNVPPPQTKGPEDFIQASVGSAKRLGAYLSGLGITITAGVVGWAKENTALLIFLGFIALLVVGLVIWYQHVQHSLDHDRMLIAADPSKNNVR